MPRALSLGFRLKEPAAAQALLAVLRQVTGQWSQGLRAWPWRDSLPRHRQQPLERGGESNLCSKGEVAVSSSLPWCGGLADGKSLTSGASVVRCRD